MAWQRQGYCEWCGQCCGSMDSPNPSNPWNTWPYRVLQWEWLRFYNLFRLAPFVGLQESASGEVEIAEQNGNIKIPSVGTLYWMWNTDVNKGGLWTDVAPYGSMENNIPTCPFLLPDDGTGGGIPHRVCTFIGRPQYEGEWKLFCGWRQNPADMDAVSIERWNPPEIMTDEGLAQWQADHPNCTFTWVEV